MTRVSKFLESELDRINNYLSMAEANLAVLTALCDDGCRQIAPNQDKHDKQVIAYLDDKLSLLEAKVTASREIIGSFKDFCFNLEPANSKIKEGQI